MYLNHEERQHIIDAQIAVELKLEREKRVVEIQYFGARASVEEAVAALFGPRRNWDPAVRRTILRRSDLPVSAITEAASDCDAEVRSCAVASAHVPFLVLQAAAHDDDWRVRREVALHATTPAEMLLGLAKDQDSMVRSAVVCHPRAPAGALVKLLTSPGNSAITTLAAKHPALNAADYVVELARATPFGAESLLGQHLLPTVLVVRFAQADQRPQTRSMAVMHPKCPMDVLLHVLASAREASVRATAASSSRLPADALRAASLDVSHEVREACATNRECPTDALMVLATDNTVAVRRQAAMHPNTPAYALGQMVESDESLQVRCAAVMNVHCPAQVVEQACVDPVLFRAAVANPACSGDGLIAVLRFLMRQTEDVALDPDTAHLTASQQLTLARKRVVGRLAKEPWEWLATKPLLSLWADDLRDIVGAHIEAAVHDRRVGIRLVVALHPLTDASVLSMLAVDPSLRVRTAVTEKILDAMGA